MKTKSHIPDFKPTTPRIRFNWGFWDGRNDALANRTAVWGEHGKSHFDKVYEAGYWAGRATKDIAAVVTSDLAWREYKGAAK